jgi:cholera toxin transcriptional activator
VADSSNQMRIFRFGLYELDGATGDLRKDGKARPRLQGQPLEILLHLLDRSGEVVTREELRQRLWAADTFVDYDHSLNAAVNKLRDALSDSADNPRFIQTIPRRGYRFIAPVEIPSPEIQPAGIPPETILNDTDLSEEQVQGRQARKTENDAEPFGAAEKRSLVLSDAQELPVAPRGVVRLLFSLIQVMYLCFYIIAMANLHFVEPLLSQIVSRPRWIFVVTIVTALVGIPVRLYLLTAAAFGYQGLRRRFLILFPVLFFFDELWALAPFLLLDQISLGLALAATAALLYVPFAQRSLLLMREVK